MRISAARDEALLQAPLCKGARIQGHAIEAAYAADHQEPNPASFSGMILCCRGLVSFQAFKVKAGAPHPPGSISCMQGYATSTAE